MQGFKLSKEQEAESHLRGRARGRLTSANERQPLVTLILEAKQYGCRLEPADMKFR